MDVFDVTESKDIYSPVTLKHTQEFVLVTFHSHDILTNTQNTTMTSVVGRGLTMVMMVSFVKMYSSSSSL